MPKIWDISPSVNAQSPVFPGDTAYAQTWVANIGPGCPVNVSAITLSPHVGAHADAPLHYDPTGKAIGDVDLEAFIGPCRVIHAIGCGPLVQWHHIEHALSDPQSSGAQGPGDQPQGRSQGGSTPLGGSDPRSGGARGPGTIPERVLVRVYEHMPLDAFDTQLPAFAPETVTRLADLGVKLIGIDSASIDPADSKALLSHQVIRERGLRVLENLLLDDVPEGDYELIALPLKLTTADASPVRAILRTLP
ncbi:cyclase family protein [Hydrogenophaga sp. PAMC20947]|uniref:cyclase family protein n=1 Tax=Hydrogenophaga sp. PAMC20947 TaxID=2565558 RepID=UPI001FFA842C|nr:cyclase family protein [Hydrogenophaga sp. PAMC20947]